MEGRVKCSDILNISIRNRGKAHFLFINLSSVDLTKAVAEICFFTRGAAVKFHNSTQGGLWFSSNPPRSYGTVPWSQSVQAPSGTTLVASSLPQVRSGW